MRQRIMISSSGKQWLARYLSVCSSVSFETSVSSNPNLISPHHYLLQSICSGIISKMMSIIKNKK